MARRYKFRLLRGSHQQKNPFTEEVETYYCRDNNLVPSDKRLDQMFGTEKFQLVQDSHVHYEDPEDLEEEAASAPAPKKKAAKKKASKKKAAKKKTAKKKAPKPSDSDESSDDEGAASNDNADALSAMTLGELLKFAREEEMRLPGSLDIEDRDAVLAAVRAAAEDV